MGWFLSKSSGRRRGAKPKRQPAAATGTTWNPQRTLLGVKAMTAIGVIVGTVYGWGWTQRELTAYATHTRTQEQVMVRLARRPAWMSDTTAEALCRVAARRLSGNPMDNLTLRATAESLAQNPWVAQVQQVRRTADGRVVVEATYRRPAALVQTDEGYYVIDDAGVWLPTDEPTYLLALPRITGVQAAAPRSEGQSWEGEEIDAALSLVKTLAQEPYMNQVASIDASARDTRGRVKLVLYTPSSWAVWGLAPGSEKMVEPEADVKLARLRRVVQTSGTIDAAGRGVYLNGATIMTARRD